MVLITRYAECPALPLLGLSGLCDSCWHTECCSSDTVWVSGSKPQEPPFPSSSLLQDSCQARIVTTLTSPCCEKPKLHGVTGRMRCHLERGCEGQYTRFLQDPSWNLEQDSVSATWCSLKQNICSGWSLPEYLSHNCEIQDTLLL